MSYLAKFFKTLVAVSLVSVISFGAHAKAASSSSIKLGVIDMQKIWDNAQQVKKVKNKLQQEFKSREESLQAKQKELQDKISSFQRDRDIMPSTERLKAERTISKLQQDLQRQGEEYQTDRRIREQEEGKVFEKTLKVAIQRVAKKGKYSMVVYGNATAYIDDQVDITTEVLESLKQDFNKPSVVRKKAA